MASSSPRTSGRRGFPFSARSRASTPSRTASRSSLRRSSPWKRGSRPTPPMNWRWSALDRYRLVSNSDAHSPGDARPGGHAVRHGPQLRMAVAGALRTGEGFRGTIEFYPEEGKYHFDGHRKCGVCMDPAETRPAGGRCPVCGKPLTVGVLSRVLELADRQEPVQPRPSEGFTSVIPLPELLGELAGTGAGSRAVASLYERVIGRFGSEFAFLLDAPSWRTSVDRFGRLLAEAVRRMRGGRVDPRRATTGSSASSGCSQRESWRSCGARTSFSRPGRWTGKGQAHCRRTCAAGGPGAADADGRPRPEPALDAGAAGGRRSPAGRKRGVRRARERARHGCSPGGSRGRYSPDFRGGRVTRTACLALTFTNRAADEMRTRLARLLAGSSGAAAEAVTVATFHSFCWSVLRESDPALTYGLRPGEPRGAPPHALPRGCAPGCAPWPRRSRSATRERALRPPAGQTPIIRALRAGARPDRRRGHLVPRLPARAAARRGPAAPAAPARALPRDRGRRAARISIRPSTSCFVSSPIIPAPRGVLCIGDPDQAIYGFRGSDRKLFFKFQSESGARSFGLSRSYRSAGAILQAASGLVAHARAPGLAALSAVKPFGEQVGLFVARDSSEEADFIAERIRDLVGGVDAVSVDAARGRGHGEEGGRSFSDFAVLFRTRAVRDSLLPSLLRAGLPLAWQDSVPLASEPPFSHLVAAMRLLVNPADRVSAETSRAGLTDPGRFAACRADLLRIAAGEGVEALVGKLLEDHLAFDRADPAVSLGEEAIRSAARAAGADLAGFLARVSLCALESEAARQAERVTLLTFHASKGLEFPIVFIAGAEEGITPRADDTGEDLEEERGSSTWP